MIQRVQTLYLLLAAIAGAATWAVPFGKTISMANVLTAYLANDNFLLAALMIVAVVFALVAIFLFKKRKLQFRLSVLGLLFSIASIALEYYIIGSKQGVANIQRSYYWLGIAFPILMVIFFFLAARGIRKDEKLIKSLDRLR
jgi:Domain of unknown function (DUF4293)